MTAHVEVERWEIGSGNPAPPAPQAEPRCWSLHDAACWVFSLSEKVAVAIGSLKKQALSVHSIDENPVRLDMAVP